MVGSLEVYLELQYLLYGCYIAGYSGVNCEEALATTTEAGPEPTTAKPLSAVITDILGSVTGELTPDQKQQLIAQIIQAILNQPANTMSSDAGAMCTYSHYLPWEPC